MSYQDDLQKQIAEHQRHLNILKQQEAGYGLLNVPTHIVTQIEDREAEITKLQAQLAEIEDQEAETGTYPQSGPSLKGLSINSLEFGSSGCIIRGLSIALALFCIVGLGRRYFSLSGQENQNSESTRMAAQINMTRRTEAAASTVSAQTAIAATDVVLAPTKTTEAVISQETSVAVTEISRATRDAELIVAVFTSQAATATALANRTLASTNTLEPPTHTPLPTNTLPPTNTPIPTPTPQWETITAADGAPMVLVPAGPFIMGSDSGESNEQPVHEVTLAAFYIDQFEVTNDQYRRCLETGSCNVPGCSDYEDGSKKDHPVLCVNWRQAKTYCEWRGDRLPTEAEWEKAARGTDGRTYPWGEENPNDQLLNFKRNVGYTTPVGSYPEGVSPYGAYDMAGNVWEWLNDWYQEAYYATAPDYNPQGPASGEFKVLRGGGWTDIEFGARASHRHAADPDVQDGDTGFRCAR